MDRKEHEKHLQFQVLYTLFSTPNFENSAWGWRLRWETGQLKFRVEKKVRESLGSGPPLTFLHWLLKSPLECCRPKDSTLGQLDLQLSVHFWGSLLGLVELPPLCSDTQLYNSGSDIAHEYKTCVSQLPVDIPIYLSHRARVGKPVIEVCPDAHS